MFKSPAFNGIALVLLGAAFLGAFFMLLRERFAVGDIYSEYSTYRTDPRGSTAFYHAIDRLPNVGTERNIAPLRRLAGERRQTVFFNGIDPFGTTAAGSLEKEAERLAEDGSRVVLVFSARTEFSIAMREWLRAREAPDSEPPDPGAKRADDESSHRWSAFGDELGIGLQLEETLRHELPLSVSLADESWEVRRYPEFWLSGVYFEIVQEEWRVLLEIDERPVLVEREVGEGSIVVMSDAYWLSNEALFRHSRPELYAWMVGPGERVVFDETHLGTTRRVGIMWLLRQFGFTTGIVVLLTSGLLFIWKNLAAFPPREFVPWQRKGAYLSGRDAGKGLVNLLRQSIPRRKILAACWQQWKDSQSPALLERQGDVVSRIDRLVEAEGRSVSAERLAATYREIDELIHQQK